MIHTSPSKNSSNLTDSSETFHVALRLSSFQSHFGSGLLGGNGLKIAKGFRRLRVEQNIIKETPENLLLHHLIC